MTLQEVTADTVRAVTDLRVAVDQQAYVANNAVSIAQAHFHPEAWFRAICAGPNLVGFVMLRDKTRLPDETRRAELSLWRFMIDGRYQKRGHGRDAMAIVLAHARSRPGITSIQTSYVAGPKGPKDFYLALGFRHTGAVKPNGEVCLTLDLA